MMRSRRFYERAAFVVVVLAALTGLAGLDKESRAKAFARVAAWLKEQDEHSQEGAELNPACGGPRSYASAAARRARRRGPGS